MMKEQKYTNEDKKRTGNTGRGLSEVSKNVTVSSVICRATTE